MHFVDKLPLATKRKLAQLPNQVLLRMGLVRLKMRVYCRGCRKVVSPDVSFLGNDEWGAECSYADGGAGTEHYISNFPASHFFAATDEPYTPEDVSGYKGIRAMEEEENYG